MKIKMLESCPCQSCDSMSQVKDQKLKNRSRQAQAQSCDDVCLHLRLALQPLSEGHRGRPEVRVQMVLVDCEI